jgi:hypothetical protein
VAKVLRFGLWIAFVDRVFQINLNDGSTKAFSRRPSKLFVLSRIAARIGGGFIKGRMYQQVEIPVQAVAKKLVTRSS